MVVARITFHNTAEKRFWNVYRLKQTDSGNEAWLSIDDNGKEYSISFTVRIKETSGFHKTGRIDAAADARIGDVRIQTGERASFDKYENDAKDRVFFSVILKGDSSHYTRTLYSDGYYLDKCEIQFLFNDAKAARSIKGGSSSSKLVKGMVLFLLIGALILLGIIIINSGMVRI